MLKPPPEMHQIGSMSDDEFTVRRRITESGAFGAPIRATPTTITNVPGNLQAMSTSRQRQYKTLIGATLFDLHLPQYFDGSELVIKAEWDFEASDGTTYRALGESMPQGSSGRTTTPVQKRDRKA